MESPTKTTHLPNDLSTEILARLPLRSISRFKSVCKTWKSITESVFFRHLFVSLHKYTSSSWSLIEPQFLCEEYIGLYGCKTWDLPKSLASYFPLPSPAFPDLRKGYFAYSKASNGLVLMEGSGYGCFVGNPILQQWVKIPPCPYKSTRFGFVTSVDEDGVVLSFKVLRLKDFNGYMDVCMYSSETGIWTSKRLHDRATGYSIYPSPMTLNGMYYFLAGEFLNDEPTEVMAHDFYSESDQLRAICLPDHLDQYSKDFKRALTTSRGYLMYIKTLARKGDNVLKVWRLNNVGLEDECWQPFCETPLPFIKSDIGSFAPMAMHPFDSDIVYIWNQQNGCVVSCNLKTKNYKMLSDTSDCYNDDCFMNKFICQEYMNFRIYPKSYSRCGTAVVESQFVLPRWMESIPCPPHVEMIDTAALLSYIASVQKTKRDTGEGKEVYWVQPE